MNKEICDSYKSMGKKDKVCKHFTGDRNNKWQLERCRHYCNIIGHCYAKDA